MEMHNISPDVHARLYKLACSGLCSGVARQIMTSLMVKHPLPGDESYDLFAKEENSIFQSLGRRAASLVKGLNSIPGIKCQPAEGAMYALNCQRKPLRRQNNAARPPIRFTACHYLKKWEFALYLHPVLVKKRGGLDSVQHFCRLRISF